MKDGIHLENVGDHLKSLRLMRKYSMRKLAKVAGVTVSYVSDLEAGKLSPTLATLRKLLLALDTDLGRFFNEADAELGSHVFQAERMRVVKDSFHQNTFVFPRRLDIHVELLDELIYPSEEEPEYEVLSSDLAGYIIQGEMYLDIKGEEPTVVGPGDAFYVTAGKPVRGRAVTDTPVRLITIYHPPRY